MAIKFLEPRTSETSFILLDFQILWLFDQAAIMIETLVPFFFYLCWRHSRKHKNWSSTVCQCRLRQPLPPLASLATEMQSFPRDYQWVGHPAQERKVVERPMTKNGGTEPVLHDVDADGCDPRTKGRHHPCSN